jgi:hypothetical protein
MMILEIRVDTVPCVLVVSCRIDILSPVSIAVRKTNRPILDVGSKPSSCIVKGEDNSTYPMGFAHVSMW